MDAMFYLYPCSTTFKEQLPLHIPLRTTLMSTLVEINAKVEKELT